VSILNNISFKPFFSALTIKSFALLLLYSLSCFLLNLTSGSLPILAPKVSISSLAKVSPLSSAISVLLLIISGSLATCIVASKDSAPDIALAIASFLVPFKPDLKPVLGLIGG